MAARVGIRAGRAPARVPVTRGRALNAALVAAGEPPLLTSYELTQGSLAQRLFVFQTMQAGFVEMTASDWPCEADGLALVDADVLFRDGRSAVYRLKDSTLAFVSISHGWARVSLAGPTYEGLYATLQAFQALYPATYLAAKDDRVPITFWTMGRFGPERRLRMIDSAPWSAVESNYPAAARAEIAELMGDFEPGKSGQLILWQGPPGTGKTWALRALASQWLPWAEFHYITDPDTFFVDEPAYMIDVLLSETYEVLDAPTGDVYSEVAEGGKWRVLILEDTGELLSANAKEKYGQGLSRLLNVVDGMIGQGLRVLCLVTTNDELGELNAAVRRPGRCAAQIVFPAFPAAEASAWLGEEVGEMTVAEMYARRGDAAEALASESEEGEDEPPAEEAAAVGEGEANAALAEVLRLAAEPLDLDLEDEVPAQLPDRPEASEAVVAAATPEPAYLGQAFETLRAFAEREQAAPTFHIHLPTHALDVSVATPAVEVPLTVNPADVHVTAVMPDAPSAPDVHVHVPEQVAPTVDVHVSPTPVEVTVEPASVEVTVERPKPHAIRVERDADGSTVYVPEELEEEESVV